MPERSAGDRKTCISAATVPTDTTSRVGNSMDSAVCVAGRRRGYERNCRCDSEDSAQCCQHRHERIASYCREHYPLRTMVEKLFRRHRNHLALFLFGVLCVPNPLSAQSARKLPEKVPPKRTSQIHDGFGINSDLPRDPY